MLHLLIHAQFGYLLHPSMTKALPQGDRTEGLKIADVGTGTGYILSFPLSPMLAYFSFLHHAPEALTTS